LRCVPTNPRRAESEGLTNAGRTPHTRKKISGVQREKIFVKLRYRVVAESGRNMGTDKTLEEAKKRLKQIEYFKHKAKKSLSNEY
jgi:hypothetical protein